MELLTPTSELEAVNLLLFTIGESPLNSLEDAGVVDAVLARNILRDTSRSAQKKGWTWNHETEFPLSENSSGEVPIPASTLSFLPSLKHERGVFVQRGNRAYDRVRHTYLIGRKLLANITFFLPYDELPETARSYIAISAARRFQAGRIGSDLLHAFTKEDELIALSDLMSEEAQQADFNYFEDSQSVSDGWVR